MFSIQQNPEISFLKKLIDMFIRCAESGMCKIVISGDRHLLDLKSHGKIRILSLPQFLEELKMETEDSFS